MLFVSIAYMLRITEYIYYCVKHPKDEFNRPLENHKYDNVAVFLAYSPVVFYGLGGLSYTCRWIHYYLLTTVTTLEEQDKADKLVLVNRIGFGIIILLSFGFTILVTYNGEFELSSITFLIIFYFTVAVLLILVINMFLHKLKIYIYYVYERKKKIIMLYSYLLASLLIFRSVSLIIDQVLQRSIQDNKDEENKNKALKTFDDIIMLSFYFIELTPSIIIIIVLWKSNNELREKLEEAHKSNLLEYSGYEAKDNTYIEGSGSRFI